MGKMFTAICKIADLNDGELCRFDIQDKALLVVKLGQSIFVSDSICTHEEADLSLGMFSDGIVTCPLHRAKFKIRSGEVVSGPDGGPPSEIARLRVYSTKIDKGELFADI